MEAGRGGGRRGRERRRRRAGPVLLGWWSPAPPALSPDLPWPSVQWLSVFLRLRPSERT